MSDVRPMTDEETRMMQIIIDVRLENKRLTEENERLSQCCAQRGARLQVIREALLRIRPQEQYVSAWDQLLWQNQAAGISSWFDADGVPIRRVSDEHL